MQQFLVSHDGKLSDATIQKAVQRLRAEVPHLDESSVEAHLALARANAVCNASLASRYEELGLSIPRFNALRWLYQSENHRLRITDLSAYLELSLPSVMRMVDVLKNEGWLERVQSETDRRVTFVELTLEGAERFGLLLPKAMDVWSELWSGMSPQEKAVLSHLLAKFRLSLLTRFIHHDSLLPYLMETRKQNEGRGRKAGVGDGGVFDGESD